MNEAEELEPDGLIDSKDYTDTSLNDDLVSDDRPVLLSYENQVGDRIEIRNKISAEFIEQFMQYMEQDAYCMCRGFYRLSEIADHYGQGAYEGDELSQEVVDDINTYRRTAYHKFGVTLRHEKSSEDLHNRFYYRGLIYETTFFD